jgi:SAM-dependent methyltransferase
MHDTALYSGKYFAEEYSSPGLTVIDIGGQDINGSLKSFFIQNGVNYICVEIHEGPGVDVVTIPGKPLPFETGSVDLIVSSSCFEHDPCFWMTFKEMCRITKLGGYIYISAPGNGKYHKFPGDNWRFYPDAGQALAYWPSFKISNEEVYSVKIEETFYIYPKNDMWKDFVCIWKRTDEKQTEIIVNDDIKNNNGPLKNKLIKNGFTIETMIDNSLIIFIKIIHIYFFN